MKSAPRTFAVKSFGCQMNVYDGERMAELMAAEGLTNREIAERTFLSPKTVEVNLTRVYRKLGVRRAALANRLAESQGVDHT